jgi:hypothetical protein
LQGGEGTIDIDIPAGVVLHLTEKCSGSLWLIPDPPLSAFIDRNGDAFEYGDIYTD